MKNIKNIPTIAVLLAMYAIAMVSMYSHQYQDFLVPNEYGQHRYVSYGEIHFTHTVPVEYITSAQTAPSYRLTDGNETHLWGILVAHAFRFKSLFSRLMVDMLYICVEHNKAVLLYPFHFFW
ncbi:hypothetical protein N6H18_12355 [Reichenbachiella agarivorans]|uniref:Uncharacterized protein n=1 Tax=Reichenbachiella agarivorans TaxID=2979464 RepID=A0ABY6CS73_9BACT|nr:hypothetical protein [Reichenbachiella agarivorans]UXP31140.1 hypothetical protein N6H18_12355 [Reichenbachiella agarivorans]